MGILLDSLLQEISMKKKRASAKCDMIKLDNSDEGKENVFKKKKCKKFVVVQAEEFNQKAKTSLIPRMVDINTLDSKQNKDELPSPSNKKRKSKPKKSCEGSFGNIETRDEDYQILQVKDSSELSIPIKRKKKCNTQISQGDEDTEVEPPNIARKSMRKRKSAVSPEKPEDFTQSLMKRNVVSSEDQSENCQRNIEKKKNAVSPENQLVNSQKKMKKKCKQNNVSSPEIQSENCESTAEIENSQKKMKKKRKKKNVSTLEKQSEISESAVEMKMNVLSPVNQLEDSQQGAKKKRKKKNALSRENQSENCESTVEMEEKAPSPRSQLEDSEQKMKKKRKKKNATHETQSENCESTAEMTKNAQSPENQSS